MANARSLGVLGFAAAIGSGLVSGIFFAFSSFVMPALEQVASATGIEVMNAFNRTVYTPSFFLAFMGTAAACLVLAVASLSRLNSPHGKLMLSGSVVFIVGCVGVTSGFNVPLNEALAAARPGTQDELDHWARVLVDWTFWNHVRTVAAMLAALLLTLGMAQARSVSNGAGHGR